MSHVVLSQMTPISAATCNSGTIRTSSGCPSCSVGKNAHITPALISALISLNHHNKLFPYTFRLPIIQIASLFNCCLWLLSVQLFPPWRRWTNQHWSASPAHTDTQSLMALPRYLLTAFSVPLIVTDFSNDAARTFAFTKCIYMKVKSHCFTKLLIHKFRSFTKGVHYPHNHIHTHTFLPACKAVTSTSVCLTGATGFREGNVTFATDISVYWFPTTS